MELKLKQHEPEEPGVILSHVILLDVRRVAQLLGVHTRTVWRLVATNELPKPVKLGAKTVRWRLSDLETYVQDLTA